MLETSGGASCDHNYKKKAALPAERFLSHPIPEIHSFFEGGGTRGDALL